VSELMRDRVELPAPPPVVLALLDDPAILRRVLPGCEALERLEDDRYRGILVTRLPFATLRALVRAQLRQLSQVVREEGAAHELELQLEGEPQGLAGSFRATIPFRIEPSARGSLVTYRVEVQLAGRLGAFGAPILRETFRRQVQELVTNLERELRRSDQP
jgi:carbon monoxide dehydrogenase subunit G